MTNKAYEFIVNCIEEIKTVYVARDFYHSINGMITMAYILDEITAEEKQQLSKMLGDEYAAWYEAHPEIDG